MKKTLTKANMKVYDCIVDFPGSTAVFIQKKTKSDARHHIRVLTKARLVKRDKLGKLVAR